MAVNRAQVTDGIEEYLEAIWRVGGKEPVSTKDLASHLGVAPPSVTGMLKRLAALGLVAHSPYGKAALTVKGRKLATEVIRRHRLSERMLTDLLGLPWEKAHDEACRFEHLITGEVEKHLSERLSDVDTCPHGHPIDLSTEDDSCSLCEVAEDDWVEVTAIDNESAEFLGYLTDIGISLGTQLRVAGKEPFADGGVLIEVERHPHALSRRTAEQIKVKQCKGTTRR